MIRLSEKEENFIALCSIIVLAIFAGVVFYLAGIKLSFAAGDIVKFSVGSTYEERGWIK
jgi:hypothetical protein